MVKPIVQTRREIKTTPSPVPVRAVKPRRADGAATRTLILEAARRRLCEGGYANLNVRDIARDAGVNHALISYHFQGKQQLVLAVLDEANAQLLERQTRMYAAARQRQPQVAAGLRLLRGRPAVRLRAPDDGADGRQLQRRGAAPRVRAALAGLAPAGRVRGRGHSSSDSGLELPVSARAIAAWIVLVLDRHGSQHDAGHHREAGPSARGAGGHGHAAAAGRSQVAPQARGISAGDDADEHRSTFPNGWPCGPGRCPTAAPCRVPYPYETVSPVREGFVERDGVRSWYAQFGDSGPWLAFAPIFQIVNAHLLKGVVPYLSQHYRVVVMDLRGNGRSDRPTAARGLHLRPLLRRLRRRARPAGGRARRAGGHLGDDA